MGRARELAALAMAWLTVAATASVWAQSAAPAFAAPGAANGGGSGSPASAAPIELVSPQYILRQGDVVQVKVYQEDDLACTSRIGKDGTITMPLLGSVEVVNKSIADATKIVHDLLEKDYLVNPRVSLNVTEFSKRRFTVLGQVQRPGTYELPVDDSVSLLQAIAAAGGYTRIGNPRNITVQRPSDTNNLNRVIKLNAESLASDKDAKPFLILPDDVIVVGEKWL